MNTLTVLTLEQLHDPSVVDALMSASVWNVAPVTEDPEIELARWQVMQLPNGDRHFVGWNVGGREGRASSRIVDFDPAAKRGRTDSGRVYRLTGHRGNSGDAMHTWRRWMRVNGAEIFEDVSTEVEKSIEAASVVKDS